MQTDLFTKIHRACSLKQRIFLFLEFTGKLSVFKISMLTPLFGSQISVSFRQSPEIGTERAYLYRLGVFVLMTFWFVK